MGNAVVYLDHQASTPCEPGVLEAMAPWWNSQAANPSSRLHRPGLLAAAAVEQARGRIATGLMTPQTFQASDFRPDFPSEPGFVGRGTEIDRAGRDLLRGDAAIETGKDQRGQQQETTGP